MTAGYIRQAAANIQPNLNANAEDLNSEYNQLQSAFDNTTGHDHSGSVSGVGAKIPLATAVTGTLPIANGGTGNTNGKQQLPARTVTATGAQAVTSSDGIIYWAPTSPADVNFTLPTTPSAGDTYEFKYAVGYGDVYNMKITAGGATTIEGRASVSFLSHDCYIVVKYIGSNIWVIA